MLLSQLRGNTRPDDLAPQPGWLHLPQVEAVAQVALGRPHPLARLKAQPAESRRVGHPHGPRLVFAGVEGPP
eukprot:6082272-Lingulodinium_polyedra.AAC.1